MGTIKISDLSGAILIEDFLTIETSSKLTAEIDVSKLSPGIYIANLEGEDETFQQKVKFIIQRD